MLLMTRMNTLGAQYRREWHIRVQWRKARSFCYLSVCLNLALSW